MNRRALGGSALHEAVAAAVEGPASGSRAAELRVTIQVLLRYGADPFLANIAGHTAADLVAGASGLPVVKPWACLSSGAGGPGSGGGAADWPAESAADSRTALSTAFSGIPARLQPPLAAQQQASRAAGAGAQPQQPHGTPALASSSPPPDVVGDGALRARDGGGDGADGPPHLAAPATAPASGLPVPVPVPAPVPGTGQDRLPVLLLRSLEAAGCLFHGTARLHVSGLRQGGTGDAGV